MNKKILPIMPTRKNMKKKLASRMYLVSREVIASCISEAMDNSGRIYKIEEAILTPEEPKKVGFNKDK